MNIDANSPSATVNYDRRHIHIIKKGDGNLAVIGKFDILTGEDVSYTSSDGGATWDAIANPYDGDGDWALVSPGYEIDPADFIVVYFDSDALEFTIKTYDDSLDSWSESAVFTTIVGFNNTIPFFDGRQRWSNSSTFIPVWNDVDTATADLEGWILTGDAVGGYTFTASALIAEDLNESYGTGVAIDQQNDHIYVAYLKGGALFSSTEAQYRRSIDGGVTWEAEVSLTEDVADDYRWIQLSGSIGDDGGEIQGTWANDDLNTLKTNVNTAVSIPAVVPTPPVSESSRYGSPVLVAPETPLYASPIDQEATTLPQYAQVHANRTGFPTYGQVRVDQDGSPAYGQKIVKLT